jgi:hypothetical protein
MLLIDKIRKDFILYILTIFTAITILTLSSTPENLLDNNLIKNNLYENIIFFKSTFPIIIFITLVFITIKKFREFQFIKKNFIFILFFFLILLQIIGTITNSQNYIKNLYYIIPKINIMFISIILLKISDKNNLKFFFNINFILFFIIFLYFFLTYAEYYLIYDNNFYSTWANIKNNEGIPRPTGMARLAMIFSAYYCCCYILQNKKYLFVLMFFNYLIFAFQSRVIIFALLFISLILVLIKERYAIIKTFKYLILIFIIPFIISLFIDFSKRNILFNDSFTLSNYKRFDDFRIFDSNINYNLNNFTSNRKQDWQNILKNFDKKRVFGYGIHGDRILINQTASNGFLYSLASGGYLAVITYFIICIYSLYLASLALLKKKFNKYSWFASSMIIFFLIRSIVENSFTIISFDFIIFFLSIFYLEKIFFNKSKSKIKAYKNLN